MLITRHSTFVASAALLLSSCSGGGEVQNAALMATFHSSDPHIVGLAFTNDARSVAAAQLDGTIAIWDVETRKLLQTLSGHRTNDISFSPSEQLLAWGSGTVTVLDVKRQKHLHRLPQNGVKSLLFTPNGRTLLTINGHASTVWSWNMDSGKGREVFRDKADMPNVNSIAVSPDGNKLAVGTWGRLYFVDLPSGNTVAAAKEYGPSITCLDYSRDGTTLVGLVGYTLTFWHADDGSEMTPWSSRPDLGGVTFVAFSPSGKWLALVHSKGDCQPAHVEILDARKKRSVMSFHCNDERVTDLAWSFDEKLVATSCTDGTVKLWDVDRLLTPAD